MKSDFKRMKARSESGQDFRRIFNVFSYGEHFLKGSKYVNRIRKAIDGNPTFNHMFVCDGGKGKACFSVFCMSCRKVKQDRMYENYTGHFAEKYDDDEGLIRDNARFGTVLHSLVPVNVETETLENETVSAVEDAVAELKKRLLAIDRKAKRVFGKHICIGGGVHVELVDYDRWRFAALSGSRTHKQKTYNEFIERSSNNAGGHYFLVHTHFLCDLDGMADADFNELFREQWHSTSRQVLIKRLTDTYETEMGDVRHELDTAYRNIANYCYTGSNHGLAYAKNWGNSGKVIETGEKLDIKGNVKTFAKDGLPPEKWSSMQYGF